MKCFKIESIEYGWFDFRIGKHYFIASDYLGYDMPKEFLDKLIKVLKESSKEWLYVMNEPGATIIELTSVDDTTISIQSYSMNKPSDALSPNIEEEIKNKGACDFSISIAKLDLTDDVITEYSLYETGNGRKYYEFNWGTFPQSEYNELKKMAFEENKKLNELESLKCIDFLEL